MCRTYALLDIKFNQQTAMWLQSHAVRQNEWACLILACMHSSSDVKEGLVEFFIHLCHLAALAAVSKPHYACKQEKCMPTHSTLVQMTLDLVWLLSTPFIALVGSALLCSIPSSHKKALARIKQLHNRKSHKDDFLYNYFFKMGQTRLLFC